MFAALLATLLFSISAICGHRTSMRLGGAEANFWRICGALFFLAIWANTLGTGTSGSGVSHFCPERTGRHRPRRHRVFSGAAAARQPPDGFAHPMPHRAVRHVD